MIKDYTVKELRSLKSIPLRLNPQQKADFLDRIMEQYWQYRGDFFFLSNNCAVEAASLARQALGNGSFDGKRPKTPKGLEKALSRSGLTVDVSGEITAGSELSGHFFRSAKGRLQEAFVKLTAGPNGRNVGGRLTKSLESFMAASAAERGRFFQQRLDSSRQEERRSLISAALIIETHLIEVLPSVILKKGMQIIQQCGEKPRKCVERHVPAGLDKRIRDYVRMVSELMPERMVTHGYGIPLQKDWEQTDFGEIEAKRIRTNALEKELLESVRPIMKQELSDLRQGLENVRQLTSMILTNSMAQQLPAIQNFLK